MTPAPWLAALGHASLEGVSLVLAVSLVTFAFPRLPAFARTLLWWAVCVRLLIVCIPHAALSIPVTNPAARLATGAPAALRLFAPLGSPLANGAPAAQRLLAAPVLEPASSRVRAFTAVARAITTRARAVANALPRPAAPRGVTVAWLLFAAWILGAAFRVAQWFRESARIERVWREAQPCEDATAMSWLTGWLGAPARSPELRAGGAFATPLVLAGPRARILLPASFAGLPLADQRAGLAHEVAHLRRHDLELGTLVALAEVLFWFHPLVAFAAREYAAAREEACDAEAVQLSGVAPAHYGELLLRFGIEPLAPSRAAASCGSRHFHQLRKRIVMLSLISSTSRARRIGAALLVIAAALILLPVRFATPALAAIDDRQTATPRPAVAPRTPTTPHTLSTPRTVSTTRVVDSEITPLPEPVYDSRPVSHRDFSFGRLHAGDWFFWGSFDDRTMEGLKRLERSHRNGDVVWFEEQDRAYLVSDPAIVAEVNRMLEPMESVAKSQSKVGAEQAKLGALQAALGREQAMLSEEQIRYETKLESLESHISAAREQGKSTAEFESRRAKVEAELRAMSERERAFERESQEFERQSDAFGDRENDMGAKTDKLMDEIGAQIRNLVHPLIENGKATPVRP